MQDELISRQAVLDLIADYNLSMGQVVRGIHALPSVKPQEKTGYWRPIYQGDEIIGYRCSECEFGKTQNTYRANYCHNCGAKMVQESEDKE